MRVRSLEFLLLVAAALSPRSDACGPDFPNRLLVEGIEDAPAPRFRAEVRRLVGAGEAPFRAVTPAVGYREEAEEADLAELAEAIGGPPPAAYVAARKSLSEPGDAVEGVPPEFLLYLRGAAAYHSGRGEEARGAWRELLALPEPLRRRRSVWAAFMIGKSLLREDPTAAIVHFRLARDFAAGGLPDRIGLAAASIGWEAQANLRLRRWSDAVALYVEHARTGDESAWESLHRVAAMALAEEPGELRRIALEPGPRRLVTAFVLCRRDDAAPWLRALEEAGVREAEDADRLALAAYRAGEFDAAARWSKVAPPASPLALWVRGKLALRGGARDAGIELLRAAAAGFPDEEEWKGRVLGEVGVVELERGRFVEALAFLIDGGHRLDAAYVAERVLTIGELREFLREHPDEELSWLLGRRLARLRRFDEAREFLPERLRPALDALGRAISEGSNPHLDARSRASALWEAARITRHQGLDLIGSELEPDWRAYGGNFTDVELSKSRASSGQERDRLLAHGILPDLRWHYRYIAAELAWQAAALSPDGSAETARRLCIAGGWLKARDPKAADRFFKALVRRCGATDLGREAAKRNWFPTLQPSDD